MTKQGFLIVALLALAGCGEFPTADMFPYEGPPILDSLPQEGKADPSPAKREGRTANEGGRRLIQRPITKAGGDLNLSIAPASFTVSRRWVSPVVGSQVAAVTQRGGSLAKPELHKLYAETCRLYKIKWSASESEAFVRVVWKESRGNPRMQNSRSSSAGLFGFLKSTRKNYGVTLSDPLEEQSAAFVRYCVNRYGSIRGALDFHRRHRYY